MGSRSSLRHSSGTSESVLLVLERRTQVPVVTSNHKLFFEQEKEECLETTETEEAFSKEGGDLYRWILETWNRSWWLVCDVDLLASLEIDHLQ